MPTNAELEARVEELAAALEESKKQHREMKQTVVTTARKYASAHGLCEVVDKAIEEAGLGPNLEKIEIDIQIPAKIEFDVDAGLIEGMSDDDRAMYVAKELAPALLLMVDKTKTGIIPQPIGVGARRRNGVHGGDPKVTLGDIVVEGYGTVEMPEPPESPWNTPPGYITRYTSNEGRVLHHFENRGMGTVARALCGRVLYTYQDSLREDSARGENRLCGDCRRRAAGMQ